MVEQEAIIVAIELGSSKISGIAGKMKDGTMQILAYAEDKTTDCVKRGVVYNIVKTTLSIKTIISKLEAALKMKITRTYIGLGGQSVRSVKSVVQKKESCSTLRRQRTDRFLHSGICGRHQRGSRPRRHHGYKHRRQVPQCHRQ